MVTKGVRVGAGRDKLGSLGLTDTHYVYKIDKQQGPTV